MAWIDLVGIVTIVLACALAPAFDRSVSKRVGRMLVVGGLFLCIAIAAGHARGVAAADDARDAVNAMGVIEGLMTALGLFFVVVASVRFGSEAPMPAA